MYKVNYWSNVGFEPEEKKNSIINNQFSMKENALDTEDLKILNINLLKEIVSRKQRDLEMCEQELSFIFKLNEIQAKALIAFKSTLQEEYKRYKEELDIALKEFGGANGLTNDW